MFAGAWWRANGRASCLQVSLTEVQKRCTFAGASGCAGVQSRAAGAGEIFTRVRRAPALLCRWPPDQVGRVCKGQRDASFHLECEKGVGLSRNNPTSPEVTWQRQSSIDFRSHSLKPLEQGKPVNFPAKNGKENYSQV